MGISGEVAGKPGGAELARHLRKIETSRPDAIREVGTRWRKAAKSCDTAGGEITRTVHGVDGAWNGESADAFVGYMGKLTGGFDKAGGVVESSAGTLDKAARAVESAKSALNSIGERALADAKKAEDAYAKAVAEHSEDAAAKKQAAEVRDAAIERAMREHATEAQTKINELNERLNGALGALKGSSGELAGVFSRLPEAGEQGFTPAPGRQVDWEAAAEPTPAPANPQEAGSDGSAESASGGSSTSGATGGETASGGGGTSGSLGSSGGPPAGGPPPGDVDQWIREAIKVLRANGVPVTEENIDEIWTIIQHESGGDPHAINDWDSNAAKGTPSKGLMQCIDPTFDSYKLPGHGDIYDPVDNIIAGVRYTFERYGGFEGHPGLQSMSEGGGYQGY